MLNKELDGFMENLAVMLRKNWLLRLLLLELNKLKIIGKQLLAMQDMLCQYYLIGHDNILTQFSEVIEGQPDTHMRQPRHLSWSISTMPSSSRL